MDLRQNRIPGQPAVRELASCLSGLKRDIPGPDEFGPDETPGLEVRLQVHDGGWQLWTGDSQYDTDHRGSWADCYLTASDNCRTVARDMLAMLE